MASSPVQQIAAKAARLAALRPRASALPSLLFLTDPVRTPDPVAVARNLPPGTGVILRHYEEAGREELARALAKICKQQRLVYLIGADATLARQVGADGVHLPEARLREAGAIRLRHPNWLITAAAHGRPALRQAGAYQIDAMLLAPVFGTESHPGRPYLGPLRFRALVRNAQTPVYGLGGITARSIGRLEGAQVAGVAVIGAAVGAS